VEREDTEATISHFIPSVELTGSRGEKLRKLDTLILYLERLRCSLAPDIPEKPAPLRELGRPSWVWFTAGIVVGAVSILLLTAIVRGGL